MSWFKKIYYKYFGQLFYDKVVEISSFNDLPDEIDNLLFIIGNRTPKWIILKCPCGCGERIDVNLMKSRRPSWTLTRKKDKISLWPSLSIAEIKCGSHFWIKDSRVYWV